MEELLSESELDERLNTDRVASAVLRDMRIAQRQANGYLASLSTVDSKNTPDSPVRDGVSKDINIPVKGNS